MFFKSGKQRTYRIKSAESVKERVHQSTWLQARGLGNWEFAVSVLLAEGDGLRGG